MKNRNIGFLQDNEREFIDNPDECENPSSAESRVRNGPGSAQGLGDVLHAIRADLNRVEKYWQEQADDRYQLEQVVLAANKEEIRKLHALLGDWLNRADIDHVEPEIADLRKTTKPLWDGVENNQEFVARYKALVRIIQNDGLREIFEWVLETSEQKKLPKGKQYNDIPWRQAASKSLQGESGLIEEWGGWDHCYVLSKRGEAVHETIQNIANSEQVEESDVVRWLERTEG